MKANLLFTAITIVILLVPTSSSIDLLRTKTVGSDSGLSDASLQNVEPERTQPKVGPAKYQGQAGNEDGSNWFAGNISQWEETERNLVQNIIDETVKVLDKAGIDGLGLLEGYRFRRYSGEYIDGINGLIGSVDHNRLEITLSDTALLRMGGFYIYHEVGHAVDYRLRRELSVGFHAQAGSEAGTQESDWRTADGYWLRRHGQTDREEATADAFALWLMGESGNSFRPVFPGAKLDTDYEAIAQALADSLEQIADGRWARSLSEG